MRRLLESPSPPRSVQTLLRHLRAGLRIVVVRSSAVTPLPKFSPDANLASKSFVHVVKTLRRSKYALLGEYYVTSD